MITSVIKLNKRPGKYLEEAIKSPVIIEKNGKPSAIIVSYEFYIKLENIYWGERAIKADQEKSVGPDETMKFLQSDD